jgi:hypothetical protein
MTDQQNVFPRWFQPRRDVAGILVQSEAEERELIASGWPDKQCPPAGQSIEAQGVPQTPQDAPKQTDHGMGAPAAEKRGPGRPRKIAD